MRTQEGSAPKLGAHLHERINAPGPKKLLAIDGGGIRGLIAIEFLFRMETLLREKLGRSDLVLADYFDYVGGTSTGAILATFIARGISIEEIREFYLTGAHIMFDPANAFMKLALRFGPNSGIAKFLTSIGALASPSLYTQRELAARIKDVIGKDGDGEALLGSSLLRTLLLIVTRNATTDSSWPISNNPKAKYNDLSRPDCNLKLPLWQLVRASTAAPIFFPPEVIDIGGTSMVFVDGGVTVYQNPAFVLFLMATLPPYNLAWPAGEDKLLLVSVGTGLSENANKNLRPKQMNLLYNLGSLPSALIFGATVEADKLCRIFGQVRDGAPPPDVSYNKWDIIDGEIGDLVGNRAPLSQKLFSYARYNVDLSRKGLDALGLKGIDESAVAPFGIAHLDDLRAIGRTAAHRYVSIDDFEGFA